VTSPRRISSLDEEILEVTYFGDINNYQIKYYFNLIIKDSFVWQYLIFVEFVNSLKNREYSLAAIY